MLYQHAFIAAMKQQIKQNQQKIIISQQVHYKMLVCKKSIPERVLPIIPDKNTLFLVWS